MKATIRYKERIVNGEYPAKCVREILDELDDRVSEIEDKLENKEDVI